MLKTKANKTNTYQANSYLCCMKNAIFDYIEFLLPKHNCVIIPEFGGFIMNLEAAQYSFNGHIYPPTYRVVFNQGLKHDDGILLSFIHNNEGMNYNAVSLKIRNVIKEIKQDLFSNRFFECGNIGCFRLDKDNNILFSPNESIVHPMLYGLTRVRLDRLDQIDDYTTITEPARTSKMKYIWGTAAAVAALFFIIPSTNIGTETASDKAVQQSGFISSLSETFSKVDSSNANFVEEQAATYTATIDEVDTDKTTSVSHRTYYIVVGGEEDSLRAADLLKKIQKTDFPKADIIMSASEYRIYVASFDEKKAAEAYLENMKQKNPKYETAWVHSKINK